MPSLKGGGEGKEDVVPVGFDEGILRGLCDMDVGTDPVCLHMSAEEPFSVRYLCSLIE